MKVSKGVTINLQMYQALKLSVEDVDSFEHADELLINEIKRLEIPVSDKIKQCLHWQETVDDWV